MTATDARLPAWGPAQRTSVLVVEPVDDVRSDLSDLFRREGYDVLDVAGPEDAMARIQRDDPDVVVLNVAAPGTDGIDLCRRLRLISDAYVVMIGDGDREVDTLVGLAVGADDYLTGSCSPRELVARVHVLTRRPRRRRGGTVGARRRRSELHVDPVARRVTVGGDEVALTRIEFDLLATLAERPDTVFSRRMLLDRVWGPDRTADGHVVDVHIANLRKKIDVRDRRHITTVRGVGYRLT